jgi:hypothetical protein
VDIINTNIAIRTLATLCIATSLSLGALSLIGSADQDPQQSLGRLPVSVHSAAAHGMTVPGAARIRTAQIAD